MRLSPRVTVIVVLVAAAIAGGAIAALTAGGSKSKTTLRIQDAGVSTTASNSTTASSSTTAGASAHRTLRPLISSAASYLGVSSERVRQELRSGKSLAQIAKETPGKSEAGLIAAIDKQHLTSASGRLQRRVTAQVRAPGGRLERHITSLREDAREYLGLTVSQLRSDERSKTLAQIAEQAGKSEAGLEEAIYDARKQQLEAAVKAGTLSASTESRSLARLRERITAYVHRVLRSPTAAVSG